MFCLPVGALGETEPPEGITYGLDSACCGMAVSETGADVGTASGTDCSGTLSAADSGTAAVSGMGVSAESGFRASLLLETGAPQLEQNLVLSGKTLPQDSQVNIKDYLRDRSIFLEIWEIPRLSAEKHKDQHRKQPHDNSSGKDQKNAAHAEPDDRADDTAGRHCCSAVGILTAYLFFCHNAENASGDSERNAEEIK